MIILQRDSVHALNQPLSTQMAPDASFKEQLLADLAQVDLPNLSSSLSLELEVIGTVPALIIESTSATK